MLKIKKKCLFNEKNTEPKNIFFLHHYIYIYFEATHDFLGFGS